jgi:hypothetical protein
MICKPNLDSFNRDRLFVTNNRNTLGSVPQSGLPKHVTCVHIFILPSITFSTACIFNTRKISFDPIPYEIKVSKEFASK